MFAITREQNVNLTQQVLKRHNPRPRAPLCCQPHVGYTQKKNNGKTLPPFSLTCPLSLLGHAHSGLTLSHQIATV